MVRLWREHPGRFYKVYLTRSSIEACFSAIKGRFTYCVRSVTPEMQKRELAIMTICRNINAWPGDNSRHPIRDFHGGIRGACAPAVGSGRIVTAPPQALPGRHRINPFRAGRAA